MGVEQRRPDDPAPAGDLVEGDGLSLGGALVALAVVVVAVGLILLGWVR